MHVLTPSDVERAREIAASAPPPSPELLGKLRGILSGAAPARAEALGRGGNSDAA